MYVTLQQLYELFVTICMIVTGMLHYTIFLFVIEAKRPERIEPEISNDTKPAHFSLYLYLLLSLLLRVCR